MGIDSAGRGAWDAGLRVPGLKPRLGAARRVLKHAARRGGESAGVLQDASTRSVAERGLQPANPRRRAVCLILATLCMVLAPASAGAQNSTSPLADAVTLERRGRYEEAARLYRETLAADPAEIRALLGLERVYTRMGWTDSLPPFLRRAEERAPASEPLRELQIRTWSALERPDSVVATLARWIDADPTNATPFSVWAFWMAQRGDVEGAMTVLREGQARVGDAPLAQDVARLYVVQGDWLLAGRAWREVVRENETLSPAAVASLAQAPTHERPRVLAVLGGAEATPTDQRLAADVLLSWGRADEAWTLLDGALPAEPEVALAALRRFADRAHQVRTLAGARARGYALERVAGLTKGAEAEQARLEAAQSFADGGDLRAAQRMLQRLSLSPGGSDGDAAQTMGMLIRVLADAGRVEEAETHYREWSSRLRGTDADLIREKLAWARVAQGRLDRAAELIGADSSVGAQAVRGWIALYRGDLRGATELFRGAGPYAQSREEATRRTAILALIQRVQPDSVPKLGEALLKVVRRDSSGGVRDLVRVARDLPQGGGRAAVLGYAGELAVATGDYERAGPILLEAIQVDSAGAAAPAAEYALAFSYAQLGRTDAAIEHLEHLILTYAESAVVPQARRLLDQVRGMIPKS
jgi:tetratricopeptide (TPR) repeat protein